MPCISFQQVVADNSVKTKNNLAIPARATHAELQADHVTNATGIRYTLDGTAPTVSKGMVLVPDNAPTTVLIEDLINIKFIRDGSTNDTLLIQYYGSSV